MTAPFSARAASDFSAARGKDLAPSTVIPSILALIAVTLGFAHVLVRVVDRMASDSTAIRVFRQLFDLDYEVNVPAWFATALWIVAVILAIRLGVRYRHERSRWFAIAAVAALLSLDESASLHEQLEMAMASTMGPMMPGPIKFLYPWVLVAGVIALIVGLFLLRFVLSLPRHASVAIILGGALFLAGALGVEGVGAAVGSRVIPNTFEGIWLVLTLIEELLEMSGVILLIHALLWIGEDRDARV